MKAYLYHIYTYLFIYILFILQLFILYIYIYQYLYQYKIYLKKLKFIETQLDHVGATANSLVLWSAGSEIESSWDGQAYELIGEIAPNSRQF